MLLHRLSLPLAGSATAPLVGNALALVLCTLSSIATAQTDSGLDPQPTRQATRAATPVPAVAYHSAFAGVPRGVEQAEVDWKAANAAVGQFRRGHADVLKWEQEQARSPAASSPAPAHQGMHRQHPMGRRAP